MMIIIIIIIIIIGQSNKQSVVLATQSGSFLRDNISTLFGSAFLASLVPVSLGILGQTIGEWNQLKGIVVVVVWLLLLFSYYLNGLVQYL